MLLKRCATVCIFCVSSCSSPIVLTSSGPSSNISTGQFGEFEGLYNKSLRNDSASNATSLLSSGFALIDNDCRDYFRKEGRLQRFLDFGTDTAAVLTSIAAGALAIGKASTNAVAILTLSTAASTGLINTVASDFLFDLK